MRPLLDRLDPAVYEIYHGTDSGDPRAFAALQDLQQLVHLGHLLSGQGSRPRLPDDELAPNEWGKSRRGIGDVEPLVVPALQKGFERKTNVFGRSTCMKLEADAPDHIASTDLKIE